MLDNRRDRLPPPKTAGELLDLEYLELRCHLLELAAGLDRLQRADGFECVSGDKRMNNLREGIRILSQCDSPERADQFLRIMSEPEGEASE